MKTNGQAITAIRERSGYSMTRLANETGINLSQLSRIESGERNGTPAQVKAIAGVLLVPITAIIDAQVSTELTEDTAS